MNEQDLLVYRDNLGAVHPTPITQTVDLECPDGSTKKVTLGLYDIIAPTTPVKTNTLSTTTKYYTEVWDCDGSYWLIDQDLSEVQSLLTFNCEVCQTTPDCCEGGGGAGVVNVKDIAERDSFALAGQFIDGQLVRVIDATADTTVKLGWAIYQYNLSTNSFTKVSEAESLDTANQLTGLVLTVAGWSLVSGLYEQTISHLSIMSTHIAIVVPNNASTSIVQAAEFTSQSDTSAGGVKVYCKNLPTANITVTVNLINT